VLTALKGRTPAQIAGIAQDRVVLLNRRWRLPLLRHGLEAREREWLDRAAVPRWPLTGEAARNLLRRHSGDHARLLADAEPAMSGWTEVSGFGRRPIALHPDPQASARDAYCYRLLSRLDFLRPLVRAALTVDDSALFLQAVETRLFEWEKARAVEREWDSVDDAIRLLNLVEALALLGELLPREARRAGLQAVLEAAWNVEIHRTRTGNHLIYEALALLAAGAALAGHPRATTWQALGRRLLEDEMLRQVLPDGMNAELCTNYHLITGTNFLKGWILGRMAQREFSPAYRRRLGRMAAAAWQLRAADGGFIALGDSDRMAGSSREEVEGRAFAGLGRTAADSPLEREWLLAGLTEDDLLDASEAGEEPSAPGGYHVWRSGTAAVLFDVAPFGLPGASHHGHADALSFEAHVDGVRFLVDPGGFSYVDHAARAFARSTAAHNTLQVDGRSSSQITGSFRFGRGARARLLAQGEFEGGIYWAGEHDGYEPVTHKRLLIMGTGPFFLVVVDRVEGPGRHTLETFFHADAGWEARREAPGRHLWLRQNLRMAHRTWCNLAQEMELVQGRTQPHWQGWVAPAYGQYLEAVTLTARCAGDLPVDVVNVLVKPDELPGEVELDGPARRVRFAGLGDLAWGWNEHDIMISMEKGTWNSSSWKNRSTFR